MNCFVKTPPQYKSIVDGEYELKISGVELFAITMALGRVNDDQIIESYNMRYGVKAYGKYFEKNLRSHPLYEDFLAITNEIHENLAKENTQ